MKLPVIPLRDAARAAAAAAAIAVAGCSSEPERRDYEAVAAEENGERARRGSNEQLAMQGCVEAMEGTNLMCE